jgi:hypothetical protein
MDKKKDSKAPHLKPHSDCMERSDRPSARAAERYKIMEIKTEKSKIPLRNCMKEGILPRFPFSLMLSGRSGSGKTNLMMNLLTRNELYGDYFHTIIVCSPTAAKYDDMYKQLKLPEDNFVGDFNPEFLNDLIESRKAEIDKNGIEKVAKKSRVCIILDDIIANRQFLESPEALKMFALLRHYLVSVIVMIQSYTKLPRALRLNCNGVAIFPCLQSEVEVLIKEVCPNGISKRDFEKVIDYCTRGEFDFMFINNHAKPGSRIRHNLDEIINLDQFKN